MYQENQGDYKKIALGVSTVGIFSIYQLARQNYVLPFLAKFGKFFKTHRLLRQYIWVAILPYTLAYSYNNYFFLNQTEKLWQIHASRLNAKRLDDPEDSQYPIEMLPLSQTYTWQQPWVHKYDLPKKWDNEVPIMLAPDYANIEEWAKVPLVEPVEGEGEGGEGG